MGPHGMSYWGLSGSIGVPGVLERACIAPIHANRHRPDPAGPRMSPTDTRPAYARTRHKHGPIHARNARVSRFPGRFAPGDRLAAERFPKPRGLPSKQTVHFDLPLASCFLIAGARPKSRKAPPCFTDLALRRYICRHRREASVPSARCAVALTTHIERMSHAEFDDRRTRRRHA